MTKFEYNLTYLVEFSPKTGEGSAFWGRMIETDGLFSRIQDAEDFIKGEMKKRSDRKYRISEIKVTEIAVFS